MTPRQFLLIGGIVLVALAVLGFTVLGPGNTILGTTFYLDKAENVAHLVLGVVALAAYWALKDDGMVKLLVGAVGVLALVVAVLGFLNRANPAPNLGVTNLEMLDDVLHLVVGVWALATVLTGKKMVSSNPNPQM